jgi:peptide/nickel transport system permease protein
MKLAPPILSGFVRGQKIARYLARLLLFFLLLHALVFTIFDLLPSAALLRSGWAGADPAVLAGTRARMGIDGNAFERYASSLLHLLRGDFGRSYAGDYPIAGVFWTRLLVSLPIWIGATLLCIAGVALGARYCALKIGVAARSVLFSAHLLLVPQFLAAMIVFALYMAVSPHLPTTWDGPVRIIAATISAALLPATMIFVATANSARTAAQAPFVTAYAAIGMDWSETRHRLRRNILVDVQPLIGRALLAIATGTVFAETTFGISGAGKLFVDGLRNSDWPTIQIWVLFVGTITIAVALTERQSG